MLKFESVFWATNNRTELAEKLVKLGFEIKSSRRDPLSQAIFFGPEAIELITGAEKLTTIEDQSGLPGFLSTGDGIFGLGLESDNIANDYRRLQRYAADAVGKPHGAKDTEKNIPLWFGFNLSKALTPGLQGWVVGNSPAVLKAMSREMLPLKHPNTCFGLEAIHMYSENPDVASVAWAKLVERTHAGLQWNEGQKTSGRRIQSGDRFFDLIKPPTADTRPGVFMITIKVTDLELAKQTCEKAGAHVQACKSRDGFIVPGSFTGGPSLRFVRTYWKAYLPAINDNFPEGRRQDQFRPLGGANTSTLNAGFSDDWTY